MADLITGIATSFVLGLLTPVGAVCVLPLYPGFLVYLSHKLSADASKKLYISLGLITISGVILFMLLLGLIFTTILQVSLTNVIAIVSPVAFIILAIISMLLILNYDIGRFFPQFHAPTAKNPLLSAFIFGFFFGAIVIPCNPAFIAAFFTRALFVTNFFANMSNFLFFGLGIGFPLFVLSVVSSAMGNTLINFLINQKRLINLIAGSIMLTISLYYLIFVFRLFW